MRARDLLTALTTSSSAADYQGIYLTYKENLIPFTTIAQDSHNQLILFFEPKKACSDSERIIYTANAA